MGTMATQCKSSSLLAPLGYWAYSFSGHGRRWAEHMLQYTIKILTDYFHWHTSSSLQFRCLGVQLQSFSPTFTIKHLIYYVAYTNILVLYLTSYMREDKWCSLVFLPFIPMTEAWATLPTMPQGQPSQERYEALSADKLLIHPSADQQDESKIHSLDFKPLMH